MNEQTSISSGLHGASEVMDRAREYVIFSNHIARSFPNAHLPIGTKKHWYHGKKTEHPFTRYGVKDGDSDELMAALIAEDILNQRKLLAANEASK